MTTRNEKKMLSDTLLRSDMRRSMARVRSGMRKNEGLLRGGISAPSEETRGIRPAGRRLGQEAVYIPGHEGSSGDLATPRNLRFGVRFLACNTLATSLHISVARSIDSRMSLVLIIWIGSFSS